LRGEQLKSVARRYGVSEDALGRHWKHMQTFIAKAAGSRGLAYGSALLAEIARMRADVDHLQVEIRTPPGCEIGPESHPRTVAVVELEAKLSRQIDTSPKNVTINLQTIGPEEAVEYARDILEWFGNSARLAAYLRSAPT
jgi:hypothetical protein